MYENITAQKFENEISNNPNAFILDVRTKREFNQGSIPGAINIDFMSGGFMEQLKELDKTKTYFVYCRSGARSASACDVMASNGFEKLFNLNGGILSYGGSIKTI